MIEELLLEMRIEMENSFIKYQIYRHNDGREYPFKLLYTFEGTNIMLGASKSHKTLEDALKEVIQKLIKERKYIRSVSYKFTNKELAKKMENAFVDFLLRII